MLVSLFLAEITAATQKLLATLGFATADRRDSAGEH